MQDECGKNMKELLRSPNLADISIAQSLLNSEGIESVIFDRNASFIYGPNEAISPRLMVSDNDFSFAMRLMQDAGLISS